MEREVIAPCSLLNAESSFPTRELVILGASGSVGSTALNFLRDRKNRGFQEIALNGVSVHSSLPVLREILREFSPGRAAISEERIYDQEIDALRRDFPAVSFFRGDDGLVEMIGACKAAGADTVLTAVVGACGIRATMESLRLGYKVALANKETMVTAGPAIEKFLKDARNLPARDRPVIVPVDSEHNAVFQALFAARPDHLSRVILTASGGPFRDRDIAEIQDAKREEVLNHPTWNMGPKITVDSAGMINKGLEIIEAHFLFSLPYDKLDVLIHRHSLVHGMVELRDGGYIMCASSPNMVFPIAHSFFYPDPVPQRHREALPPEEWQPIDFQTVDPKKYPGYGICLRAAQAGGTGPAIFNAANEVAVDLFLEGSISFVEIPRLLETVLERLPAEKGTELGLFLEADARARAAAREAVKLTRD